MAVFIKYGTSDKSPQLHVQNGNIWKHGLKMIWNLMRLFSNNFCGEFRKKEILLFVTFKNRLSTEQYDRVTVIILSMYLPLKLITVLLYIWRRH